MYSKPHWTDLADSPVFSTRISLRGENIMMIAGQAGCLLRKIGVPADRITEMYNSIQRAQNYEEALTVIEHWFEVTEPE